LLTFRNQWGRGVIATVRSDRTTYVFENGGERTFMNGHPSILEVPLPTEERASLATLLLRRHAQKQPVKKETAASKAKAARAKAAKLADAVPTVTFERQLAIFAAAYPGGFTDPRFVLEERGTPGGPERRKDAAIALAQDVLRAAKLDAAIEKGQYTQVFTTALSVLTAFESLAPKAEKPAFSRIPASSHERFAKALRELLHGTSSYTRRFDAFCAALELADVPWTIATVFSAAVHPTIHAFVKATMSQRQAKALDLDEPPVGPPNGAGYAEHLNVANKTRDKLIASGLQPRDLFDVYSFGWRTLTRSAQAGLPETK
jgi:hypothetical protein